MLARFFLFPFQVAYSLEQQMWQLSSRIYNYYRTWCDKQASAHFLSCICLRIHHRLKQYLWCRRKKWCSRTHHDRCRCFMTGWKEVRRVPLSLLTCWMPRSMEGQEQGDSDYACTELYTSGSCFRGLCTDVFLITLSQFRSWIWIGCPPITTFISVIHRVRLMSEWLWGGRRCWWLVARLLLDEVRAYGHVSGYILDG
jgi:hypothetical protein